MLLVAGNPRNLHFCKVDSFLVDNLRVIQGYHRQYVTYILNSEGARTGDWAGLRAGVSGVKTTWYREVLAVGATFSS